MTAQTPKQQDRHAAWARAIMGADRTALARAITCAESSRMEDQATAQALLSCLAPHTGAADRIGLTGPPGVGKSTFLEALGLYLLERGHKIAVLAIDPSSSCTGGSILGDKTRMNRLSMAKQAFVRPSPSSGVLGGVTTQTHQAIALCEAAGYNPVFVETVGVGQSETLAADMTDCFIVMLAPGGGDSLQGLKKGLVERADLFVVNKADGDTEAAAYRTAQDYRAAVSLLPAFSSPQTGQQSWRPPVLTMSALTGAGVGDVWAEVERHKALMKKTGALEARRHRQREHALERALEERLAARLRTSPAAQARFQELLPRVIRGDIHPATAAEDILGAFGLPPPQS